jgi:hypothetical protein
VCGIDCLICQDYFFENNPLDIKENYEHFLDFALHLSRPLSVSVSLDFPCTAYAFFPERVSKHFQGLRSTYSEICTKFYEHSLSDPSRNRTPNKKDVKISTSIQLLENIIDLSIVYSVDSYVSMISEN